MLIFGEDIAISFSRAENAILIEYTKHPTSMIRLKITINILNSKNK